MTFIRIAQRTSRWSWRESYAFRRPYSIHAARASNKVQIVEVGPRDGLQNEKGRIIPVGTRVELIDRLVRAGMTVVEAGSFVSPKWVPQMAGTAEVLENIAWKRGVHYPVLVPNLRGLEDLRELFVRYPEEPSLTDEVAVFVGATDGFSRANVNCTVEESLRRTAQVVDGGRGMGLRVRGYVSVVVQCPYEGAVSPARVREVARELVQMGCYEVSLGETVGRGRPHDIRALIEEVTRDVKVEMLAGHFHDTYGMGVANVLEALACGVRTVDAAVGGLGGCPYSPGATGNVATEDVIYALQGSGYDVGSIDLDAMAEIGSWISAELGRETESRVGRALKAKASRSKL